MNVRMNVEQGEESRAIRPRGLELLRSRLELRELRRELGGVEARARDLLSIGHPNRSPFSLSWTSSIEHPLHVTCFPWYEICLQFNTLWTSPP